MWCYGHGNISFRISVVIRVRVRVRVRARVMVVVRLGLKKGLELISGRVRLCLGLGLWL